MREFSAIERHFRPLSGDGSFNLTDDAAVIQQRSGFDLVVTKDLIVEGVHFLNGTLPAEIAFKALAVNISDCVAKGAIPHGYFVGLSVPETLANEDWFSAFADGLEKAQVRFGCILLGGDTTQSKAGVTVSITAVGFVEAGRMVERSGAQVGDHVFVTGTIGDAALGLKCLQHDLGGFQHLEQTYTHPAPPVGLLSTLLGKVTASADVSDGLIADASHIASASDIGMEIHQDCVPLSSYAQMFLDQYPDHSNVPLFGGDDYQTLFTAPGAHADEILHHASNLNLKVTKIGQCVDGNGVQILDPVGAVVDIAAQGYEHFGEGHNGG